MKRIIVSATSDLVTDQRVAKSCLELIENGYTVTLIGRRLPKSLEITESKYQIHRFKLLFTSGPLFYLEFQFRLMLFLLSNPFDVYWSNDLDTVVPNYLFSKLRNKKLVFDSHELFTEVPELEHSPIKKKIWAFIERKIASKADVFITVNSSLADIFQKTYGVHPFILRNVPILKSLLPAHTKSELNIPLDHLVLIIQGSGLNHGRGLEELLKGLQGMEKITLFVIGSGTAIPFMKKKYQNLVLTNKVRFIDRLPHQELMRYTQVADIGIAFDKNECLNFKLALPNKIFDYLHAGIGVICGPQPEISKIVSIYRCGIIMERVDPETIAQSLLFIHKNPDILSVWKKNSLNASKIENWENEKKIFQEVIQKIEES